MKTLAFFFALIIPVSARLGETMEECRVRYGKETDMDEENSSMVFTKAGFRIYAVFVEGRVGVMTVAHSVGKNVLGTPPDITEAELTAFKEANSGGSEWVARGDLSIMNKTWDTKDNKRVAVYDTLKHALTMFTTDYAKKRAAKKAEEEKKNLEGF